MTITQRFTATLTAACIGFAGFAPMAHANGLITTEQVAASEGLRTAADARAQVLATLSRADVSAALAERGVDVSQARERVDALTDAEAAQLARDIDSAPAGSGELIGTVIFVFVLLLTTDILGYTKIFPFTHAIR